MEFVAMSLGGLIAAGAMYWARLRRDADRIAAWVLVANMNTLLRLDLDHLSGDDENFGLSEMRGSLKELATKRPAREAKLLEHYNALVGIAIRFGTKVHDAHGNVDLQAVANRRDHVHNALAVGDQIEAALGGIDELAKGNEADRSDPVGRRRYRTAAA
ncbi:MAG TPA: hypothetical protein VGX96_14935 [Candidatus Elarobacter sp.]|jgi:hypothetical protein|nr:hypothetical protein [Candidatus Elarobacter sp.]